MSILLLTVGDTHHSSFIFILCSSNYNTIKVFNVIEDLESNTFLQSTSRKDLKGNILLHSNWICWVYLRNKAITDFLTFMNYSSILLSNLYVVSWIIKFKMATLIVETSASKDISEQKQKIFKIFYDIKVLRQLKISIAYMRCI